MQCAWFSVWQVLPLAVPVYDITCFGVVVKLEEFFVVSPHSSCVKTMWSGLLFFLLGLIQVNNGQQSPTRSRGCSSRSGKPCVFPFFYNGTLYDGEKRNCTQRKNNVSSVQNTVVKNCKKVSFFRLRAKRATMKSQITQNVLFEFLDFGIFHQFLSHQKWPVW